MSDDKVDLGEVAPRLRRVLDAIDAGEVEATRDERAYVAGAADVLAAVAGSHADRTSGSEAPDLTRGSGPDRSPLTRAADG